MKNKTKTDTIINDFFNIPVRKNPEKQPESLEKKSFDKGYEDGIKFVKMLRKI